MQTIYNYLSEAGWAWFALVAVIASGMIFAGWRPGKNAGRRCGFEVFQQGTSEADQRNEQ